MAKKFLQYALYCVDKALYRVLEDPLYYKLYRLTSTLLEELRIENKAIRLTSR